MNITLFVGNSFMVENLFSKLFDDIKKKLSKAESLEETMKKISSK